MKWKKKKKKRRRRKLCMWEEKISVQVAKEVEKWKKGIMGRYQSIEIENLKMNSKLILEKKEEE